MQFKHYENVLRIFVAIFIRLFLRILLLLRTFLLCHKHSCMLFNVAIYMQAFICEFVCSTQRKKINKCPIPVFGVKIISVFYVQKCI